MDVAVNATDESVAGADNPDVRGVYAKLFMRFAKRGGDRVLARIELAAGKRDLAGVGAHPLGPVRQDHPGLGPVGHRDQHRSRADLGRGELALVEQARQLDAVAFVEQPLEAVEQRAHAGTSGNTAPWLATVVPSPVASACSASWSQVERSSRASQPRRTAR